MSNLPLISYKKKHINDFPQKSATLLMLSWVIENRTGFVGIPKDFPIPKTT